MNEGNLEGALEISRTGEESPWAEAHNKQATASLSPRQRPFDATRFPVVSNQTTHFGAGTAWRSARLWRRPRRRAPGAPTPAHRQANLDLIQLAEANCAQRVAGVPLLRIAHPRQGVIWLAAEGTMFPADREVSSPVAGKTLRPRR